MEKSVLNAHSLIFTISCPDQSGIVYAVTGLLTQVGANITQSQEYRDPRQNRFYIRLQADVPGGRLTIEAAFAALAARFEMDYTISDASPMRTIIMCSKDPHCLTDLLAKQREGRVPIDVVAVVSNHETLCPHADFYGVPFIHIPVTKDTKADAEAQLLKLVDDCDAELVVLARYMQILSDDVCQALAGRIINIHHSFLPSFKGARPYAQAHARGVKLIGATAHYVTADLDEGPIIEQDVARVSHAQDVPELQAMGAEVERQVLYRAVRWHAEHRVLHDGLRTVVFE
ncbi:formyltetrahydrofolate deformylase [Arcanobacterium buesumense]|uniref:Formyltetrahydrofolate deformylase n=1 Tax=Arcanobacterium buesumense TaxID=2722751 RepID=A0A6H2EMA1_9ACTO|nr:formyltetrahydrofolate deformylase [Arcanobacterium buesumense]QJC22208.1 formyltetrahydrofolate deformylase [Arcanobacterium buesumense]